MKKFRLITIALSLALTVAGTVSAALIPNYQYVIGYDAYLQQRVADTGEKFVTADTLIVVNNPNPQTRLVAWIEFYDKKGELIWEGEMWDGGQPTPAAPPNGFVWITAGMAIPRTTVDPFGNETSGEKFYIRISALNPDSNLKITPIVEIKQVVYNEPIETPEKAIWRAELFKTWAETVLGGNKNASGVIFSR
jgi:hypothetical protein